MEHIDQYEPRGRSIYFWLRRIAVNGAFDTHRAHQKHQKIERAAASEPDRTMSRVPGPDEALDVEETSTLVHRSLELLSASNARYSDALRWRLLEDCSREECAARMGVTVGNFDVLLHRACKAFRKVFPP